MKINKNLSRRNFIRTGAFATAATAGAIALSACNTTGVPAEADSAIAASSDGRQWDYECDILFVGAGSSMMGAIDAHNAGAKVILIEKRDVVGGDTTLCGGVLRAGGNTTVQQEYGAIDERTGKADTLESFYEDMFIGETLGTGDPEVIRKCVEWSPGYVDWFMERGVEFKLFTAGIFPVPRSHQVGGELYAGFGKPFTDAMEAELQELGVDYHVNTRGMHVIRDERLNILGVQAKDLLTGETKLYRAKAVVLSTGGNSWNEELNARYNPITVNCLSNTGAPGQFATGDGHVMAMECGASMNGFKADLSPGSALPQPIGMDGEGEQTTSFHQYATSVEKSNIFVNINGERFCDETKGYENQIGMDVYNQPTNRCAVIIDQALWDQPDYIMVGSNGSKEHMMELLEKDIVKKADTIEDLAKLLNINSEGLANTVERFNDFSASGNDADFSRPANTMRPLNAPPFYGFLMMSGGKGAACNVRVNSNMEVLDRDKRAIPGLYASGIWYNYGMVDYQILGDGYSAGGSGLGINASITTAKIAGASAAAWVQAQGTE